MLLNESKIFRASKTNCELEDLQRSGAVARPLGRALSKRVLQDAVPYGRVTAPIIETQDDSCRKMFAMSPTDELSEKLRALDAEFDRKMRARGFDPLQAENVALPSHLATLYDKREQIKAELAELEKETDD